MFRFRALASCVLFFVFVRLTEAYSALLHFVHLYMAALFGVGHVRQLAAASAAKHRVSMTVSIDVKM